MACLTREFLTRGHLVLRPALVPEFVPPDRRHSNMVTSPVETSTPVTSSSSKVDNCIASQPPSTDRCREGHLPHRYDLSDVTHDLSINKARCCSTIAGIHAALSDASLLLTILDTQQTDWDYFTNYLTVVSRGPSCQAGFTYLHRRGDF